MADKYVSISAGPKMASVDFGNLETAHLFTWFRWYAGVSGRRDFDLNRTEGLAYFQVGPLLNGDERFHLGFGPEIGVADGGRTIVGIRADFKFTIHFNTVLGIGADSIRCNKLQSNNIYLNIGVRFM